VKTGRSWDIF